MCRHCRIGVVSVDVEEVGALDGLRRLGWEHARRPPTAHEPDPVRLEDVPGRDILTVCDICGEPDPRNAWSTTGSSMVTTIPTGTQVTFRDRDDLWLVCDGCVLLVHAHDVPGLMRRRLANPIPGQPENGLTMAQRVWIADRISGFLDTRLPGPEPRTF